MKILFYQPYNQAVPYIESVAECFANDGHTIYFLSHAAKGETHRNLEQFGCKTFSHELYRSSFLQYYKARVSNLAKFCRENTIDIVYSHFQEANLISVIAQYFCKATFVINRHHSDCAFIDDNWKERWGDKIINRLAKGYISTSPKVHHQIVDIEKTNPKKVRLINYGYNFDKLPKADSGKVAEIRRDYRAKLLLVKAARFIPEKRHIQLIEAMDSLINSGHDIKLLLLGEGPLAETLKSHIHSHVGEED